MRAFAYSHHSAEGGNVSTDSRAAVHSIAEARRGISLAMLVALIAVVVTRAGFVKERRAFARLVLKGRMKKLVELLPVFRLHY